MPDVNNTKHHLLLGESDWQPAIATDPRAEWSEREGALRLKAQLFRFPRAASDKIPEIADRRGAARDRFGNYYWVDATRQAIRYLAAGRRGAAAEHFWRSADLLQHKQTHGDFKDETSVGLPAPYLLGGLAVTTEHYLVAGTISPPGLLLFDLHAGGLPLEYTWPAAVSFSPFDVAPTPDGGVVILDRALTSGDFTGARLWFLDRRLRLRPPVGEVIELAPSDAADFRPVDAPGEIVPATTFPQGFLLMKGASPAMPILATAIAVLPDKSVLVLENDPVSTSSTIYRFRGDAQIGDAIALDEVFPVRGHDFAFLPAQPAAEDITGLLYVADREGNQVFAYHLRTSDDGWTLKLSKQYFPMRLFSGKGLVAANDRVYFDAGERWLALIEQPRPRFEDECRVELPIFNGKTPRCVWHRLFIDGCIPPGAEVVVESRAGDVEELLPHLPYQPEPGLYLRPTGAELPFAHSSIEAERQAAGDGTWELLFQHSVGQFQQLRLTLRGSGRNTPIVRSLRSYYPRFSYLKEYLPAVYREDAGSASFLDRFLSNVEGFFTIWEGSIANSQLLFDTRTAPAEYLDWLATWFGLALDPVWEDWRRRLLLKHAIMLFNQRGTLRGVLNAVALATDPCPEELLDFRWRSSALCSDGSCANGDAAAGKRRFQTRIVERFLLRRAPGVVFGAPGQVTGPGVTTEISDWTPAQGAEPLHQRFRDFLRQRYAAASEPAALEQLNTAWQTDYPSFAAIGLSPTLPENEHARDDWRVFLRDGIGFTYAEVTSSDVAAYRAFIARRYRRPEKLSQAYALPQAYSSFSQVNLPTVFPAAELPLHDWIQFVSLYLPAQRAAHRFTVLVPVKTGETFEQQAHKAALVKRIVELEKPAHTRFDLTFFWAMFRVGEARLGLDTAIDAGSRFTAIELGRSQLAGGVLEASLHPWNVENRKTL